MGKDNKSFVANFDLKKLFWGLFLAALFLIAIVAIFPNNDTVVINNEHSSPFNDGWTLENEGQAVELPFIYDAKSGDSVVISKVLPEELKQYSAISLSFISSLQSIKVEVGNESIYEYCQNPDAYFEVQPPPAWHVIRLSQDMAGEIIRITYSSPYDSYAGVLNSIEMGSKYANVTDFMGSRLLSIALCFAIFIFGIFVIVICLFVRNRIEELNRLLYLGISSCLVALWSACETKAMQIFTGNVQLIMFVTFLSIMLFPIAFLLFFREGVTGRIRKIYNIFIAVFSAYFIVIVLLQIFSIATFNDFFIFFLAMLGVMLILIFVSTIQTYRKNRTLQTGIPIIAIFFLLLFSMVDMYRFLFLDLVLTSYADTTQFVRIGILFMIFILGYSSIKQILVYYSESTKADAYRILSQTDSLSGLKNRTYLLEVYPSIIKAFIKDKKWFAVIMVDIDNFKNYNDHYGHGAGDDVIRRVADVLAQACAGQLKGAVRYGGEEFLLLLPQTDIQQALVAAEKVKNQILNLNIPHEYSITAPVVTVSQGIYSSIPQSGDSLELFIDRADQALYKVKKNNKNEYAVYEG